MSKYKRVEISCYSYKDMIDIYIAKYNAEYQLIGYYHDKVQQQGYLILHKRRK